MNRVAILSALALIACARAAPTADQLDEWAGETEPEHKYANYDLAALQANVSGEDYSQLSLNPNDEEELQYLAPEHKIFSQFCLQARDTTMMFATESSNALAATTFNVIFSLLNNVAENVLEAQKEAIEESSRNLTQHGLNEPTETDIEAQVEPEARQKDGLLVTFGKLVRNVFSTIASSIASETFKQLQMINQKISLRTLKSSIELACENVSQKLKSQLEKEFTDYKVGLVSESLPKDQQAILAIKLENVQCVTSKRVVKMVSFCEAFRMGSFLIPMIEKL